MNPSPYHSPLRAAQAEATRERVLEASARVVGRGDELTYAAVAAEAEVQERTVYRYFPTKSDLELAMWWWVSNRAGLLLFVEAANETELIAQMRASFAGFDAQAPLVQAMLHSRQGLELRLRPNADRQAMFARCLAEAVPGLDAETSRKATAAVQILYSATAWESLRNFWGMEGNEAAEVVELALSSMFEGLRRRAKPSVSARKGNRSVTAKD